MALKLLFFISLCISCGQSYAQSTFQIAGKEYLIPAFTQDTVPFVNKVFFQKPVIAPLKESDNLMEIRCFFSAGIFESLIALRADNENLWADCYYAFLPFQEIIRKYPQAREYTDDKGRKTMALKKSMKISSKADSIMNKLLAYGFFTIQDEDKMIDSLRRKDIFLKPFTGLDGSGVVKIELKMGGRYREFYLDPDTDENNTEIDVVKNRVYIFNLLGSLYRLSGLPVPGW